MAHLLTHAVVLLAVSPVCATPRFDYDRVLHSERNVMLNGRAAKVAPGSSTNVPYPWMYQGCYTEGTTRTLPSAYFANNTGMTNSACTTFCASKYYIYAGTEYSQECYCGNSTSVGKVAATNDCSSPCKGNSSEACGGGNRLSIYWNGVPPPGGPWTNPGPGGYGFYGCYTEGTGGRALANGMAVTGPMTVAKCVAACSQTGYAIAGLEYAGECFCDNTVKYNAALAPGGISDCSMPCKGNSSEYCGGSNRLNIYWKGYNGEPMTSSLTSTMTSTSPMSTCTSCSLSSSTDQPTTSSSSTLSSSTSNQPSISTTSSSVTSTTSSTSSSFVSTTAEVTTSSPLSSTSTSSPTNQPSTSSSISSSTEQLTSSSTTSSSSSSQSPSSTSTSTTPSLGPVPTIGAYSAQGCWTEVNGRALRDAAYYNTPMTLELCASNCAGYKYWGVEYGGECYCGYILQTGSALAPITDCSFICPGNKFEYCGAGNRLQLYMLGSSPSSTGNTVTSTSVISTSSTSSTSLPTQTGLPSGWKYGGCYTEGNGGRAITNEQSSSPNTIQNCISICIGKGYTVAGLEYASECYCDNSIHNGAVPAPESKCNTPCAGDSTQKCGAGNILSVYYTGNLTVYQPPMAQADGLPGSWTYQGCYNDSLADTRALQWQIILANNNTATSCLTLCSEYGYMAAGMEYGRECYCGDDSARIAAGSIKVPETDCQVVCTGAPNYYCGGGQRLSYYTWTGTPLYVWQQPTGSAMGSYQFLIGGVVIPLMTTVGINNKVVFLEKSGTGPPNTTGTYELDLAYVNDFSKAWRPLHVKTDVFCAAGITLPDKVGRQLNIGGWSGASTYGVRLYWPDGSPGIPGINDWQENVNEVSLLAGRWYPTAMVMTNGSVLIIGGETGSNASPTPSLEILPPPAGGYEMYLDWLDRTDPYNLYPFLSVLPSGGILCLYYNEARILDESTFDTTRTLPNMPGTVASFLAGRTYPLEGTAVLLPQYPPYSDPITVLVCGGSTAGAGYAIDNCISAQPELTNVVWTIERMPTPRVLTCMTALPDGTYMILNGALSGVGGFGLATDPNFEALLYDPARPIGQRMSIMATATVGRLYHSEAILLPDGRVLVSGSDPEDGKNPQEYRVEVLNPPYTLSGAIPPALSISNTDWAYGASIVLTVTIPSGNFGAVRVSMLASVTSTHGNSMGQRTLFLAATCGQNGCTVVAPPTPHVAPPGWYQIFVLDGAMPGTAVWIRIGGSIADAAGIGNWPPYKDFTTPGLGAVSS